LARLNPVIIIVEDEFLLRMEAEMIENAGFGIQAGNADEAIAILQARPAIGGLRPGQGRFLRQLLKIELVREIPEAMTEGFVSEHLNRFGIASKRTYEEPIMATAKEATKQTARGRKQDRAKVAGAQKYEVSYEAKKTGKSASAVNKAVRNVGNVRKNVEKQLSRMRR
jgi:hypothetical protein